MTRPAAVLFDFDGTLIDREPLIERAVVAVCHSAGLEPPAGSVVIGRAWQDIHADLAVADRLGWSVADLVDRTRAEAAARIAAGDRPVVIAGGADLIARLATAGIPVAIVSGSTRAELDDGIEQLGIGSHLRFRLGAEDYRSGKPDPEGFLLAATRLGVAPGGCVVFEDSSVGIAAGLAAGMRVVGVAQANRAPGHPGHQDLSAAHRVVSDLTEVDDRLLASVLGVGSAG